MRREHIYCNVVLSALLLVFACTKAFAMAVCKYFRLKLYKPHTVQRHFLHATAKVHGTFEKKKKFFDVSIIWIELYIFTHVQSYLMLNKN